jgi:hypothetical protein
MIFEGSAPNPGIRLVPDHANDSFARYAFGNVPCHERPDRTILGIATVFDRGNESPQFIPRHARTSDTAHHWLKSWHESSFCAQNHFHAHRLHVNTQKLENQDIVFTEETIERKPFSGYVPKPNHGARLARVFLVGAFSAEKDTPVVSEHSRKGEEN